MYIRAKFDFECPTNILKKGQVADVPEVYALQAIRSGKAIEVESRKAIRELRGIETREVATPEAPEDPPKRKRGRPRKDANVST